MEFILGYLFGDAVRQKNPIQLILGFMGASLLLWIMIALIAALCAAAPQAAAIIEAFGINKAFPFLNGAISQVQMDLSMWDVMTVRFLFAAMMLCAAVMFAFALCLAALHHLVRLLVMGATWVFNKARH